MIADDLDALRVPVDRLDLLEGNPRRGDVEAVKRSYARFGQRKPIVARHRPGGRGEVTAGNTQLVAARELGWPELAVVWADDDDDTAKAWALADNRTSELGFMDEDALAAYLESVKLTGDADLLEATGYDEAFLVEFFARRNRGRDPDAVPEHPPGEVWFASLHAPEAGAGLQRIGFRLVSLIIWDKGQWAVGRGMYQWQHEPCWVARRGDKVPFLGERYQSTVWRATSPKMITSGSEEEKYDHPAQKPIAVIQPPILNHLEPLGLVYEPFCGSGTTLMAAEVNGRRCCAVELEPRYVDITCRRWQDYTGEKPVRESTGEPVNFADGPFDG